MSVGKLELMKFGIPLQKWKYKKCINYSAKSIDIADQKKKKPKKQKKKPTFFHPSL
jgi:hypothetical protein